MMVAIPGNNGQLVPGERQARPPAAAGIKAKNDVVSRRQVIRSRRQRQRSYGLTVKISEVGMDVSEADELMARGQLLLQARHGAGLILGPASANVGHDAGGEQHHE